jgi:surface protein
MGKKTKLDKMKQLKEIIFEKLKINSKSKVEKQEYKYHPSDFWELKKIIDDRVKEENDDIDFNNIDISNIDDLEGTFAYKSKLTKIDISAWNVSKVKSMMEMFAGCKKLESIGDISDWKIESLTNITGMFYGCGKLTNTGDLDKWDASKIKFKQNAFSQANEYIIPKWA